MKTRYMLLLTPLAACAAQGDGPTQYGFSPDSTCDRYLECMSTIDAGGLSHEVEEYGNDSPCWSGSQAEGGTCSRACAAHMALLGACGCTTVSGCEKVPPPVGGTFNCLERIDGLEICRTYKDLDEGTTAIASQECAANGGSYPSTCPLAGATGTCSFAADGMLETDVFYGGISATDVESACEMEGGHFSGQ